MKTTMRNSIKNNVRILWTSVIAMVCLFLVGCSSEHTQDNSDVSHSSTDGNVIENTQYSEEASQSNEDVQQLSTRLSNDNKLERTKAQEISLNLENYSIPGVLTINKPVGWKFYKAGDYNTIAFLTRDETEPLRQVFLFGEVGVFYTNQEQKDLEIYYQNNGGYSVPWIDMPVVFPFDGQTFFENFYSIMNTQIGNMFRSAGQMPVPAGFDQITVISQTQVESTISGLPTYLVRAVLSENGAAAQGIFIASPRQDAYGHGTAYFVAGITAPLREFGSVQATLTEVLNSFTLDPSYVQSGINVINENGERFKEISQTLSKTSDIITKGYTERHRQEDVRIEKEGDQIMNVERVYDPETGEVYEIENGFYDYYNIHREDYPKNNLQQIPDNDYNAWKEAPIINHSYVLP